MRAAIDIASLAPFVGPRPFERTESELFFGREAEVSELVSHVVANQVVLLHAPSGAGKSSLLNAGLIPALEREEGFQAMLPTRVRRVLAESTTESRAGNVFVFNALLNWSSDPAAADSVKRRGGRTPLAPDTTLTGFLASHPRPNDARGRPVPRALLFDQFEEIVLVHPERWEQRSGFFEQLADALAQDARLRVLLAFREDYLASLDPFLPILPDARRFRLERLRAEAALAAVVGPLEGTGRSFAPGVAEDLVRELRMFRHHLGGVKAAEYLGEFVEPVQLQLVCTGLWADLPADVREITDVHVRDFGGVDQVLIRFYAEAVEAAAEASGVDEAEIRDWIGENFITRMGTRGTVVRGPSSTAGMPNEVIDVLEERRLIRREWRAGAGWYELSHDRFIGPIEASNAEGLRARYGATAAYGEARTTNEALALAEEAWIEGRYDDAVEAFNQASGLFDRLGDRTSAAYAILQTARLYGDMGRQADSLAASRDAAARYTELEDTRGTSHALLCEAESRLLAGDVDGAVKVATSAARMALEYSLDDLGSEVLTELIDAFIRAARAHELDEIERVLLVEARNLLVSATVSRRFAVAWTYLDDHARAERAYEAAARVYAEAGRRRDAVDTLLELAGVHEAREDYGGKADVISRAMALVPDSHLVRERAVACWYAGRWDAAIADFTTALEHWPDDVELLSGRGQALAEAGKFDLALEDLERAIEYGGLGVRAYSESGKALALGGLGRFAEAFEQFQFSLRREPGNAWAYFNRALTHERAGRDDDARADYRRALEMVSPPLNPWRVQYARKWLAER